MPENEETKDKPNRQKKRPYELENAEHYEYQFSQKIEEYD